MRQSRLRIKELRKALTQGSADAALLLLAHSRSLGHGRLAVRRYFSARFLGAEGLEPFQPYCAEAASRIAPADLIEIARDAARGAGKGEDVALVASELLAPGRPFVLSFEEVRPRLGGAPRLCGPGASLLGKATVGARSWLGPASVIRADGHFVEIGDDFRLGEMSTVHIAHAILPTIVGDRVTVGRNAVVHACTVGDDCVIEDGVVVLDGSTVEAGVLVEAGSTVFPRSTLKSGLLYAGSPARPVRPLEPGELDRRARVLSAAIAASLFAPAETAGTGEASGDDVFVAHTAALSGRVAAGPGVGVFFGCKLEAAANAIVIGKNSNVQDNTVIDAAQGTVRIGDNTTIGHNVHLRAASIGAAALIGIGSLVDAGTVVDDDVLLAAGSVTRPGQHIERGRLWGGRPARPIARLDEAKREMMAAIIGQYRAYGAAYREAQARSVTQGRETGHG